MTIMLSISISLMSGPKRTRYYLELRRLCRERDWNINKII